MRLTLIGRDVKMVDRYIHTRTDVRVRSRLRNECLPKTVRREVHRAMAFDGSVACNRRDFVCGE